MKLPELTPDIGPPPATSPLGLRAPGDEDLPPDIGALLSYLEHDPEPMIVLDPHYRILAANTAYQRQFGVAGAPHIGHKCYQVSHHYDVPCDQAGEHCPMKRAQSKRGPDRVLHIHFTPRGPEHIDVELRPIFDQKNQIIAYVERLATVRSASARPSQEGLVGRSAAFNAAFSALHRVAPSKLPVLLLGESGTGKELFARALHETSPRAGCPLVAVDCSGIAETLFESEFFGYEKGAFTGAIAKKPGLMETAQGGTLFLDEIGDVPLAMQVKLLRLIETGTFRRVGGTETLHADFRLVAATHKPLRTMVEDGRFRQDLYYRISAFPIQLPALRERREDIALLVDSILQRIIKANDIAGPAVVRKVTASREALEKLEGYAWPGNVRELRNVLERACLFCDDGVIRPEHLPENVLSGLSEHVTADANATRACRAHDLSDEQLASLVRGFSGTRKSLASHLGWSERTLYRRLRSLGSTIDKE
ncbi:MULTISPECIES: sigma-54 interaction domain-containing protein [Burkholderia cepacia complex]|uniref:sigma-54 interaction domain-containing protein n=1 Tax=Burkholderia cepacia complex TaxID=87882 RepID=UPI001CF5424E|nr:MULTISPECIES: sigma 54-interacting transcriptional regulator [Burkholderia cepacia complex]MCA8057398.1 sigma 54-interacting transcriptional regulator [Burkholderia cepacia]MDN7535254.1 sigma 54-interacting transcriptional regulator [Burkholderia orbicola]